MLARTGFLSTWIPHLAWDKGQPSTSAFSAHNIHKLSNVLACHLPYFFLLISHPPPPKTSLLLIPPARRVLVSASHSWAEEEEDEEPGSFHQEQSARELENERALN